MLSIALLLYRFTVCSVFVVYVCKSILVFLRDLAVCCSLAVRLMSVPFFYIVHMLMATACNCKLVCAVESCMRVVSKHRLGRLLQQVRLYQKNYNTQATIQAPVWRCYLSAGEGDSFSKSMLSLLSHSNQSSLDTRRVTVHAFCRFWMEVCICIDKNTTSKIALIR